MCQGVFFMPLHLDVRFGSLADLTECSVEAFSSCASMAASEPKKTSVASTWAGLRGAAKAAEVTYHSS